LSSKQAKTFHSPRRRKVKVADSWTEKKEKEEEEEEA
jgi:hypothetical protein